MTSFPRTDEAHIQINLSAIFILVAFLLWKLCEGWRSFFPQFGRSRGLIAATACLAVLIIPYVWSMKIFRCSPAAIHDSGEHKMPGTPTHQVEDRNSLALIELPFPRCEGVRIPMHFRFHFPSVWISISETVQFLRTNTERGECVFVFCEPQIIYYLAERDSVVQKENYFIHLATMGLIARADDVRLTDEQLLGKIEDARPRFIVRARQGEHTKRIATIWPKTAKFIEESYQPLQKGGTFYEILQLPPRS
jgi:hypothetical protein